MRGFMIFSLALTLGLASAPASAQEGERLRVLVLDLSDTGALGEDVVKTITGLVAVELSEVRSLDVVSGDDVRRLAELEAERQLAGCDEASCLAEIAGALGARYVVFGQAGRLGELLVVNLSLFDSEEAQSVGRASVKAQNLEALPPQLGPALRKLLSGVVPEEDLAVLPADAPPPGDGPKASGGELPVLPIVVASAGALLITGGIVSSVFAFVPAGWVEDQETAYRSATTEQDRATAAAEAKRLQGFWYGTGLVEILLYGGITAAVLGLGLVGGGVAWAFVGGEE